MSQQDRPFLFLISSSRQTAALIAFPSESGLGRATRGEIGPLGEDVENKVPDVEMWLDRLYVSAEGAGLRDEDKRKAVEVAAILAEIERALCRHSRRTPITLVDAAAGKSYVGLLAAKLIFEPSGLTASVVTLERDPARAAASGRAAKRLNSSLPVDCRATDIASASAWPCRPDIVAALHACGPAADAVIDRTIAAEAQVLLLVPCCTSRSVPAAARAEVEAERLGIPRQAPVRRRFVQAWVDAARTLRLEAAGYHTEVVEFVGSRITPHNLLWRSRRVLEPVRMSEAARKLEKFLPTFP